MGRAPCSLKQNLNRGAWTAKEDMILTEYVETHGECGWRSLPMKAGDPDRPSLRSHNPPWNSPIAGDSSHCLNRCGKSCRLRWLNYLRPNIKRGNISADEEDLIIRLHRLLGNRWSLIAGRLPGRTDNEIKNYWNTHLSKKLTMSGVDPKTHRPLDNAAPTVHSPHTTFPVQNQNSPSESISKECNSNVMQLTLVKNSEDDIAAAFDNAPDTIATGNRPDKPLFVNNNDQVDVSKSWSQLLEGTCAYDDHPNSELIVTRLSDDILVDESCFEAESEYSLSFNIPSVCTSSSSHVGTEFEQSDRLLAISNSTESITRSNDSYSDPDCVPLTDADSIDFRTIEEFCMESLLIETPHHDLEEIYRQPERDDCTDMFYRDVNCFATGTPAEQGMNEIYSNALHLDWTDELLDQYLQRHSTVDPDDPLDHLLESEPEDFWNDGLMLAEQSKTDADSYADIIVDLSF